MITGARITLLVSGSIAAYKSAELVRELIKAGAKVNVAMTPAATEFITPLTMQTLSGNKVSCDLFEHSAELSMGHIRLADETDLVLVAPATADLIAKCACGFADSVATSILLATKAPIVIAPAMNVNMWTNEVTQDNVADLRERGAIIVEPEEGVLACGWSGKGRMASIESIIHWVAYTLTPKDLLGSHVIVSAGPTREAIDPVRYLSNRSSGKMGYAIAQAAQLRGANVSLVSGPSALEPPFGVSVHRVETADQMHETMLKLCLSGKSEFADQPIHPQTRNPVATKGAKVKQFVFMVAAVADYRPANARMEKIKRQEQGDYSLPLVTNIDILKDLGANRKKIEEQSNRVLKLVGFAAEVGKEEELIGWAREKLQRKNADLIVANFAIDSFEKDTTRVWLIGKDGTQEEIATADKKLVAGKIISAALRI